MLTELGDIIKLILHGFVAFVLITILVGLLVIAKQPREYKKVIRTVAAIIGLVGVAAWALLSPRAPSDEELQARKKDETDFQQKADHASALFKARCSAAGEKVQHRINDVDGVVWMRWRTRQDDRGSQYGFDDPYGHDCTGEECIENLLRATEGTQLDPEHKLRYHKGYRYVESVDPADERKYRYTLRLYVPNQSAPKLEEWWAVKYELVKEPIDRLSAKYGVTWDDISSTEDRDSWIAGGRLKVVDLRTKESIAERTGYLMDSGQGSGGGTRQPWTFAMNDACPSFPQLNGPGSRRSRNHRETTDFVTSVLIPDGGDK